MYGEQSIQCAQQIIDIGVNYVAMKAFEQALPHLKKALKMIMDYLHEFKSSMDDFSLTTNESSLDSSPSFEDPQLRKLLPKLLLTIGKCYLDMGMLQNAHVCLREADRQKDLVFVGEDPCGMFFTLVLT